MKKLIAMILCAATLTACGAPAPAPAPEITTPESAAQQPMQGTLEFKRTGFYTEVQTPYGMSTTKRLGMNDFDTVIYRALLYDFDKRTSIILCDIPGCTHLDDTCGAYIQNYWAGYVTDNYAVYLDPHGGKAFMYNLATLQKTECALPAELYEPSGVYAVNGNILCPKGKRHIFI